MRINVFAIFLSIALAVGCGQNVQNKKAEQSAEKVESFAALPFPDVMPPAVMSNQQDIAEYMAIHWWDGITDPLRSYPCDSLLISGVNVADVEQRMANWTNVLGMVDMNIAGKAMKRLYDRAEACEKKDTASNVFERLTSLVDKYFYDPNSPLRNEDYYAFYAERLANSSLVEPIMQEKYARQVRLAALNKVGTPAADFRFSDKRGKMYTLYGIKAEYTLLFFSNPGCNACKDIIDVLNNDQVISGLISQGTMAVLNIYIDEDLDAWRSYMPIYPDNWYNGFDPDLVIRGEELYNVRAIPSLYLLDKNKVVIMKDAPEARMFDFLSRL